MIRRSLLLVAATIAVFAAPLIFIPMVPVAEAVGALSISPVNMADVMLTPVLAIIVAWAVIVGIAAALIGTFRQRSLIYGRELDVNRFPLYRDVDGVFRRSLI